MRRILAIALALAGCAAAAPPATQPTFIPGQVPLDWRGPDGNTIIFDAPDGLVVVDTGRHPAHAQAILDFVKARGRPIAAILNTHWHLDHTTGNWDLRRAYPGARVYATGAIDGALRGFLNKGKQAAKKRIADPKTPEGERAQLVRGRYVIDHPEWLKPTASVTKTARMKVAGRRFDVHVAPFAATEADLWLYDPKSRTAVVGDLVVDIVPFMDTACVAGWRKALDEIEKVPFQTLVPGHGSPMTRAQFLQWKGAFDRFVDCGSSKAVATECTAGWARDAAPFIGAEHKAYAVEAAAYYLDTRLRSAEPERTKYCHPL